MSRVYKKPSVIEALCEFRFNQDRPWDLTIPGLIYEKVRTTFPIRRQQPQMQITISTEPITTSAAPLGMAQFLRKDEKALIQIAPYILSINQLAPYPTWLKFRNLITKGLQAYRDVANPGSISRIGLRYINHIQLLEAEPDLASYFEFRPFMGPQLPQNYGAFIVGAHFIYHDSRDYLKVQLSDAVSPNPQHPIMALDLDYFLTEPGAVDLENVSDWIEEAHQHVEEVFEACITDRVRQLLGEIQK